MVDTKMVQTISNNIFRTIFKTKPKNRQIPMPVLLANTVIPLNLITRCSTSSSTNLSSPIQDQLSAYDASQTKSDLGLFAKSNRIYVNSFTPNSCTNLRDKLNHRIYDYPQTDFNSRVGTGGNMTLLKLVLQILSRGLLKRHRQERYCQEFLAADVTNNIANISAQKSLKSASWSIAGFTLIELLVVIIIIGILAAIALPSFLSQANKARMAEAKSYIGSMNRTQHGYYLQFSQFASSVDSLGIGLSQGTTHYNYSIVSSGSYPLWKLATNFGQAKSGSLKSYAGVVAMVVTSQVNEVQVRSVMCISGQPVAAPASGDYDTVSNFPTCPNQFLLDETQ